VKVRKDRSLEHTSPGRELTWYVESLKEVLDQAPDSISIVDLSRKLIYQNRVAARYVGCTVDEFNAAGGFSSLYVRPELEGEVAEQVISGHKWVGEIEMKAGDGTVFPVLLKASGITDGAGRVIGILGVISDIREQVRAREALQRSEAYFRSLIENAHDIIIVLGQEGRIRYASPSFERAFGYRPDEVVGASAFDFLHPDDLERLGEIFQEGIEIAGHAVTAEYRIRARDGEWRCVEAFGKNLLDDPAVAGVVINSREITERKRAEEVMREAEERYRKLVENVGDLIFTLSKEGRAISLSPSFERITGWTREEWIGRTFVEVLHPDDMSTGLEVFGKVLAGQSPPAFFLRFRNHSGEYQTGEFVATPHIERGEVVGIMGVGRDVTERLRYEEALRASEERLRRITDNMMDMVSQVSAEGIFEYIGPSHHNYLGYQTDEMLGRSILEFLHPDDLERIATRFVAGVQRPEAMKIDYRYRHAGGHYLWLESVANPIFDEEGGLAGAIIGTRDITDRRQTEKRLEELNHCFLSLGTDFKDNIELLVITGRAILGGLMMAYYRPSEEKSSDVFTSWEEDGLFLSDQARNRIFQDVTLQGAGRSFVVEDIEAGEYAGLLADIEQRGVKRLLAYPVSLKDEIIGFLCLLDRRDEAFSKEEKEILGMLARSISIEEERWAYEEVLRDFINITSHELRHPITLMKGYSEVLKSFGDELDEDTRLKALDAIDKGTERLDKLVSALLDTSRIERGSFLTYKHEVDLRALVGQVVEEMQLKECSNLFTMDFPRGPSICRADPEKLTQLMVILLENAAKYSPPSSRIIIRIGELAGKTQVSVIDNGSGVPEEDRKRIFDRLYQVGDAIYHSVPGIGLGLYIARKIVEVHGGEIWCEPNPAGGSIFSFTLP
jgi:PAS domain S-box-containing protein